MLKPVVLNKKKNNIENSTPLPKLFLLSHKFLVQKLDRK